MVAGWACVGPPAGAPRAAEPATPPQRLIAVAPSVVEILFALELGERVVGVGDYASWPPAVGDKLRIGGLFDPRFEQIVALAPDLAILLPSEERLAAELLRLDVETLTVRHQTLAEIEESILAIAERAGVGERGRRLAAELERGLTARRRQPAPRLLLLVARERGRLAQLTAVGGGTFLAEIVERLGAVNVLADLKQPYPQVGLETVIERRPEVIVELQPAALTREQEAALLAEWHRFPEVPAVASGCLAVVAGAHVLLPGPRLPRLFAELETALDDCGGEPAG